MTDFLTGNALSKKKDVHDSEGSELGRKQAQRAAWTSGAA